VLILQLAAGADRSLKGEDADAGTVNRGTVHDPALGKPFERRTVYKPSPASGMPELTCRTNLLMECASLVDGTQR